MAFDFKKEYKEFYAPPKKPGFIAVPKMNYVAARGQGDPNEEDGAYQRALNLLYGVAFTIKMSKMGDHKIDGYFDYVVPPLEGFWRANTPDGLFTGDKSALAWISCIRLPDFVTEDVFRWAVEEAARKKKADFSQAEFFTVEEGLCVQCMHVGPYDAEPKTIAVMRDYAESFGYEFDLDGERRHHEIYLSDPRRAAAEKLKTALRLPIRPRKNINESFDESVDSTARSPGERIVLTIKGVEVGFRWIPAGRFTMGDDGEDASRDETPHEVVLTEGYWLAETPTTQRLWTKIMGDNPSFFKGCDLRPVDDVTWESCRVFVDKMNEELERQGRPFPDVGFFRFPTEAEWEYACRAGTSGNYNAPNEPLDELGWYRGNSDFSTYPVGQKKPNAWGLYDMHGNVREWCYDLYVAYPKIVSIDPAVRYQLCDYRIMRGGSWRDPAKQCRSTTREKYFSVCSDNGYGFRILLTSDARPSSSRDATV